MFEGIPYSVSTMMYHFQHNEDGFWFPTRTVTIRPNGHLKNVRFEMLGGFECLDAQFDGVHCQNCDFDCHYNSHRFGVTASWREFWVGILYEHIRRRLYVQLLPCLGFWVRLGE